MSTPTRELVFFSGRVQGVGFRYTAQRIARNHPVTGYVRNLPDGRVELVAEGSSADVTQFVNDVRSSLARYIQDCDVHELDPTDEFDGFEIRH